MIGLITRIIYFVKDMEKATAFYRDKLGLTVVEDPQLSPSEWVEFDADPCRLALHKAFETLDPRLKDLTLAEEFKADGKRPCTEQQE